MPNNEVAETIITDPQGNRLYPVTICTICPLEFDEAGRQECLKFMNTCEDYGVVTPYADSQMLDKILRPIGGGEESHSFCCREAFTHQLERLRGYIAALDKPNIAKQFATLRDDPAEVKSRVSVIVATESEVLAFLNLEVARVR